MEKFIKDNIIYVMIVVIAFFAGVYFVYNTGNNAFNNFSEVSAKKEELATQNQKLETLKKQKLSQNTRKKKDTQNSKVIYEVSGEQFSPDASFGIMFDNILANMTNSGLRIRKIDYNYSPDNDLVLQTNAPGYNACELSFKTVGTYSQLQTFLKNLAKETYLTGIQEIYIEPYDKDKSILIADLKIRLYTKTI